MSFGDWIFFAGIWLMAISAPFLVKQFWRGTRRDLDELSTAWWADGEPSRRGFVRMLVPAGMGIVLAAISVTALEASEHLAKESSLIAWRIAQVSGALAIMCIFLGFSIMAFNRPKTLVPPHYRDETGAIVDWIKRRLTP